MSQTEHNIRTTQIIYRFDMNSTFDLPDLAVPLQSAMIQVGRNEAPFRRPSMVHFLRSRGNFLDVPETPVPLAAHPWPLRFASATTRRILPSPHCPIKFIIGTQQYKAQQ